MKFIHLSFIFLTCFISRSFAQDCGFDGLHKNLLKNDPQYRQQVIEAEAQIQKAIKEQETRRSNARAESTMSTLYYIPVVVHVVHTGEPVGSINNPSEARIIGAINYLNDVFAGTHPGLDPSGAGNIQIQFVLAKSDRNCEAFNGIDRIDFSGNATYVASGVQDPNQNSKNGISDNDLKKGTLWDPPFYYNIWLVNKISGNTLGYATFPGFNVSNANGVVMVAREMDSLKMVLVHEIGHGLNLYHVFEGSANNTQCQNNTDCTQQGDGVCDTDPITFERSSCRTGINPCTGTNYSKNTEYNFMSYSRCNTLFTPGQKARMLAAMTLPSLAVLARSPALLVPGISNFAEPPLLCTPSFPKPLPNGYGVTSVSVNDIRMESGNARFDGNGYLNFAANCNRRFTLQPGGTYTFTVSTSGYANEQVRAWIDYNKDGVFDNATEQIILANTLSNFSGNPPYPAVSAMFTIPPGAKNGEMLRMRVIAEPSNSWNVSPIGDACFIPSFGQVEDYAVFISASVLPAVMEYVKGEMLNNAVRITWKTSSEINTDAFEIERSYTGKEYSSIGTVPASGHTNGDAYAYSDKTYTGNVIYYRIKQVDKGGQFNYSTVVTVKRETAPENAITITNNPFADKFGITVATPVQSKVKINLLDITGKLLYTRSAEALGNTTISITPDTRKLLAGMYLVQVTINGKTTTRKIIKQ
ncbi:T9SS type A sorting domain-containing protein [Niastella caeni]|uniref:T9SS type A sorting domain-containing protein n=1 Tax=Niastella caeni TaxID=2569763 RepID=A0A4S8HXY5_9BACT|nr:M43 family zinc metalloprotease [Niastella caeni]THU40355.1 T9SS type A sorting domain-containing protein [Niastella caeni]